MAESTTSGLPEVSEPFPVFLVANRYVLYDINTISYVRRTHHITGVLIGGLPQAPQQNVFLGVPLELMPEEARLLVEKGAAYIVDDIAAHKHAFIEHNLSADEKKAFLKNIKKQGVDATKVQQKAAVDRKMDALKKIQEKKGGDWNDIPVDMFASGPRKPKGKKAPRGQPGASLPTSCTSTPVPFGATPPPPISSNGNDGGGDDNESLFGPPANSQPTPAVPSPAPTEKLDADVELDGLKITPTTSHPPLRPQPPSQNGSAPLPLPLVGSSYPLFRHLHDKDYFLAPGLRFGCQYMAYPGDPLRFHSHFLCNGMAWDEEFNLLDIVGGGRLGTGVKKGFLVGGAEKKEGPQADEGDVRAFCIEWGGM